MLIVKYILYEYILPLSLQGREIDLEIYIWLSGTVSMYGLGVDLRNFIGFSVKLALSNWREIELWKYVGLLINYGFGVS